MAGLNQAVVAACVATTAFVFGEHKYGMNRPYPKFEEWLAMREGLWLADKNAVAGMSRIDPLVATPKARKADAPKRSKTPINSRRVKRSRYGF